MRNPVERVLVVVDDAGLARLSEVVGALRAAGLHVDQVLDSIGAVSGTAVPTALPALRAVAGVEGVEPVVDHHLPPPDSDLQ